jgi:uncharacterized repeat protein (TIGR02543 family)
VDEALKYRDVLWKFDGSEINNPGSQVSAYSKGYYLQYGRIANIVFDGNGGTVYEDTTHNKELIINTAFGDQFDFDDLCANTKRKGYTFRGWYSTPQFDGGQYTKYSKVIDSGTLYAKWDRAYAGAYFYKNWPATVETSYWKAISQFAGDPIGELPIVSQYGKGYRFVGWNTQKDGKGDWVTSDYVLWEDEKPNFYAQWETFNVTYRMHYDGIENSGFPTEIKALSTIDGQTLANSYFPDHTSNKLITAGYYSGYWSSKEDGSGGTISKVTGSTWFPTEEVMDMYLLRRQKSIIFDLNYPYISATTGNTTWYSTPVREAPYTYYGGVITQTNLTALNKPSLIPSGKVVHGYYTALTNGDLIDFSKPLYPTDNTGTKDYIRMPVYMICVNETSTLTFKDYDGTVLDTQTVKFGDPIIFPQDPVRSGYIFTGWDKELGTTSTLEGDTVVTAQYRLAAFDLKLDGNGGTIDDLPTKTYKFEKDVSIDQVLSDVMSQVSFPYHTFSGWYTQPTGGARFPEAGNSMPDSDLTLYAHWVRSSSEVIYKDWDDRGLDRQEVAIGGNATPPANPDRLGYTFTGWDKPSTNIQAHTIITAQYSKNSYKLTLDGNGGTLEGKDTREQQLAYGDSFDQILAEGAAEASHKYYTFAGWYTDKTGGSKYPGSGNTMSASNVTVYAHWTRTSNEVIYKDWDETILIRQEVAIGGNATPPADPSRTGYTFTGWDKESTNIQANTTITAKYSKNSYKLTLDGNGGTLAGKDTREQQLAYGDSFDQILSEGAAEASQKYYTFAGWYTDKTGGSKYAGSGNTMSASNVTVYAHWTRTSNEVIYKDWDETILKRQEVAIGGNATPPADPSRTGYTFTGWDKESTNIQANTTITAQYSKNSYKLTLEGNGGTLAGKDTREQQLAYGDSFDQILLDGKNEASQSGYTFVGWYTEKTGGSKYPGSGNTMPASDITVYAHWDSLLKPVEPEPSKPESRDEEEIITVPVPPSIDSNSKPTVPDTGGKFEVNPDNPYDVTYTKPDGTSARDEWVGDGMDWYHVDEAGKLSYDWYLEGENTWYKLNKEPGDKFGAALTSWNHESMDSKWYFFDPATTKMLTGWQKIDGKWFYFTKQNEAQTYYGSNHDRWIYDPSKPGKPYGSMYRNERTPDGYLVDENGVLIN